MDGNIVKDRVSQVSANYLLDTNVLLTYLFVRELLRNRRCLITSDVRQELAKLYGEIPNDLYDILGLDVVDTKRRDIVEEGKWIPIHHPDNLIVATAKKEKATVVTADKELMRAADSEGIHALQPDQLMAQTQNSQINVDE